MALLLGRNPETPPSLSLAAIGSLSPYVRDAILYPQRITYTGAAVAIKRHNDYLFQ